MGPIPDHGMGPRPTPTPPPPRRRRRWGGGFYGGYGYGGGCGGGCLHGFLSMVFVLLIIIAIMVSCATSNTPSATPNNAYNNTSNTTAQKTKLSSSAAFKSDCIEDGLGWFGNSNAAGNELKNFYDKTGVQPYILLMEYDGSIDSDDGFDDYSFDYYVDNIVNEDSFLFVYMDGKNGDFGRYTYVIGDNTATVIDSNAIDDFLDYLDDYWDSDMTTDALFENAFDKMASGFGNGDSTNDTSATQEKKTSRKGVLVAVVVVIILIAVIVILLRKKAKNNSTETVEKENPNILN
jgi:hypothetical protein